MVHVASTSYISPSLSGDTFKLDGMNFLMAGDATASIVVLS
jgi:hypothetical protein